MKYANISIEKNLNQIEGNLGDYVQFIAIDNIYTRIGIQLSDIQRIEYFDLMDYDGEDVILPINFFYVNPLSKGKPFILSPKIHPIYLGLHLTGDISREEANFFSQNLPIGCRDENTLELLKSVFPSTKAGDIYLQGCITATLPRREQGMDQTYTKTYIVDVSKSLKEKIPSYIKNDAIELSQLLYGDLKRIVAESGCASIYDFVKKRFKLYRDTAKLVITSRMHCAIPCVAMGIPVIFIVPTMSSRFTWLEKLIPIYTLDNIHTVNWEPEPFFYEEQKEWIINSAIRRIQGSDYQEFCDKVNNWYLTRDKKQCPKNSGLELLKNYALHNWHKEDEFQYLIWGVTFTSEDVYRWMQENFPKAHLVAVIDEFREIVFHGLKTMRSSRLTDFPNCYYIGTGASASIAMKEKVHLLGADWVNRSIPIIP